ncbi:protein CutA isoform X2 [Biomphalaria glabrata]|uniref:Protein CutA homolog isoform X1 n=1 Tax=Biomphalaria glabrata TaxID=6526 RepID=A0A2C9M584_BIOGL|nr:protein CutA homolog isoform X1 [Biomphalaria glabrata]KAI8779138.1 protein CutA isoform X2 [Biomphalaria glabrata]
MHKAAIIVAPVLFVVLLIGSDLYMPLLLSVLRRVVTMAELQTRSYTSGTASMAFVTVPNIEVGKKLAGDIVKNKLAACVNIIPQVTSIYEWEDKIQEDSELILMIKTLTVKIDELSEFVRKNHPYDVAEVISAPIENGNPPYLEWISKVVTVTGNQKK